jgi:hypothetical protein
MYEAEYRWNKSYINIAGAKNKVVGGLTGQRAGETQNFDETSGQD